MRFLILLALVTFSMLNLSAQLDIRVGVAGNLNVITFGSSSIYKFFYSSTSDFFYGGNNFELGPVVDFEYGFKKGYWKKKDTARTFRDMAITTHKSLMLGVHFSNHQNVEKGFTEDNDDVFSTWTNRYLRMPLIYKLNIQPFILDEDFHFSLGLGVTNSFLISSTLEESVIIYSRDLEGNFLYDSNRDKIIAQTISDKANAKRYGKTYFMMYTVQMNMSFRRLYLGIRAWFSLTDQYLSELEDDWSLNNEQSIYFGSYVEWDKVHYAGGAMVLAFKIN